MLSTLFKKKSEDDTYMKRLGAAKENNPSSFWMMLIITIACISGIFYSNFKAMGLATGATGPIIKHGLAYTFLQPFYSIWAIYYVLLGHKTTT